MAESILLGVNVKPYNYLLDLTRANHTWVHHGEPLVSYQLLGSSKKV